MEDLTTTVSRMASVMSLLLEFAEGGILLVLGGGGGGAGRCFFVVDERGTGSPKGSGWGTREDCLIG